MAQVYRVCSGNTSIDITVTFSKGACDFWYDVYQDYHTKQFYHQLLTVTLSQASPVGFYYNYGVGWTTTKDGDPYSSGYYTKSEYIPPNVTTHSWYVECRSEMGENNNFK